MKNRGSDIARRIDEEYRLKRKREREKKFRQEQWEKYMARMSENENIDISNKE